MVTTRGDIPAGAGDAARATPAGDQGWRELARRLLARLAIGLVAR